MTDKPQRPQPTPGIISSLDVLDGTDFVTLIGSYTELDDPELNRTATPYVPGLSMHYWHFHSKKTPGKDKQQPHLQDEVYVILEGTGQIDIAGKITDVKGGDLIFVPAHMPHHFIIEGEQELRMLVFFGPDWCGRSPEQLK